MLNAQYSQTHTSTAHSPAFYRMMHSLAHAIEALHALKLTVIFPGWLEQ
jgi:hypothetical protein